MNKRFITVFFNVFTFITFSFLGSKAQTVNFDNGVYTIAGGTAFATPTELAIDGSGNLYTADEQNNIIRKITPAGVVTTFSGSGTQGFQDGPVATAQFNYPTGVTFDASGNMYVADRQNFRIRKIASGVVSTLAGNASQGNTDGTGTVAQFIFPHEVTCDPSGNIYVLDSADYLVRKVTPAGVVTTISRNIIVTGIRFDATGNMYTFSNYSINKTTPGGVTTVIAGNGTPGYVDGTGSSARFIGIGSVWDGALALDAAGNIYVSDDNRIRKITQSGVVTTVAGSGTTGYLDGALLSARFDGIWGIAIDPSGIIYVSDAHNAKLRKIVNGSLSSFNSTFGTASATQIFYVSGTTLSGNLTVTAPTGFEVSLSPTTGFSPSVVITPASGAINTTGIYIRLNASDAVGSYSGNITLASAGATGKSMAVSGTVVKADQTITFAPLSNKTIGDVSFTLSAAASSGLTVTYSSSNTSVATVSGNTVTIVGSGSTVITASQPGNANYNPATSVSQWMLVENTSKVSFDMGKVTTLAGSGLAGLSDATGTAAQFKYPTGIAIDASGNIYVADQQNSRIRKITSDGTVTTYAGTTAGYINGASNVSKFNWPSAVAFDGSGNLFVADQNNKKIRKIAPDGTVSTFAGTSGYPQGIAVDGSGNVFYSDITNNTIVKITAAGVSSVFAGNGTTGSTNGTGTNNVSFNGPAGIRFDGSGNLFVADQYSNKIRKITPAAVVTTVAGTGAIGFANGPLSSATLHYPTGVVVVDTGNILIADKYNNALRMVSNSSLSTFAGTGTLGYKDDTVSLAIFNYPADVVKDASGVIYVVDNNGHRIRKVLPSSLNAFTTYSGTASAPQVFFVSGSGLTADMTISAPAGYELSLAGTSYSNSITITSVSGTVSSTPIFIRLSANDAAGIYNGNITLESTGAFTKYFSVNGTVISKIDQNITFGTLPVKKADDIPFIINATASSGLPVTYTSSDPSVAVVSGNTVTIVGAGTTNITASQAGNATYNPATDVVQMFTVSKVDQAITFGPLSSMYVNDPSFTLNATSSSGLTVTYTSSDPSVAVVSGNTVTIVGAGTTNITASQAGNATYNPATDVVQVLTVSKVDQAITFGSLSSMYVNDPSFTLNATSSSGLTITYTSSDPSVAVVSGNAVTIVGSGTTNITASQAGNTTYNSATDVVQVLTVSKVDQTITFGVLAPVHLNDPSFALNATSSSGLTITYTSSDPSVAVISGNTVTIVGSGTTNITASQAGNATYNSATDVVQVLTVSKVDQAITFGPLSSMYVNDPSFTLNATSSSGLTITYTSSDPSVAVVSGNTVTIVGQGTTNITASQTGNATYNPAADVVQLLTVNSPSGIVTSTQISSRVYPNPSRGIVNIELDQSLNGEVILILRNVIGEIIFEHKEQGGKSNYALEVSGLDEGSYLLQITNESKMLNQIIIVK